MMAPMRSSETSSTIFLTVGLSCVVGGWAKPWVAQKQTASNDNRNAAADMETAPLENRFSLTPGKPKFSFFKNLGEHLDPARMSYHYPLVKSIMFTAKAE